MCPASLNGVWVCVSVCECVCVCVCVCAMHYGVLVYNNVGFTLQNLTLDRPHAAPGSPKLPVWICRGSMVGCPRCIYSNWFLSMVLRCRGPSLQRMFKESRHVAHGLPPQIGCFFVVIQSGLSAPIQVINSPPVHKCCWTLSPEFRPVTDGLMHIRIFSHSLSDLVFLEIWTVWSRVYFLFLVDWQKLWCPKARRIHCICCWDCCFMFTLKYIYGYFCQIISVITAFKMCKTELAYNFEAALTPPCFGHLEAMYINTYICIYIYTYTVYTYIYIYTCIYIYIHVYIYFLYVYI